jgi:hypothetical protein
MHTKGKQMTTIRFHIHDTQIPLMTSDAIQFETPSAMTPKTGILSRLMSHVQPGQFLR